MYLQVDFIETERIWASDSLFWRLLSKRALGLFPGWYSFYCPQWLRNLAHFIINAKFEIEITFHSYSLCLINTHGLPFEYLFGKGNHNIAVPTLITLSKRIRNQFFRCVKTDILHSWLDNTTLRMMPHLLSLHVSTVPWFSSLNFSILLQSTNYCLVAL